jgi:hypothetical protein
MHLLPPAIPASPAIDAMPPGKTGAQAGFSPSMAPVKAPVLAEPDAQPIMGEMGDDVFAALLSAEELPQLDLASAPPLAESGNRMPVSMAQGGNSLPLGLGDEDASLDLALADPQLAELENVAQTPRETAKPAMPDERALPSPSALAVPIAHLPHPHPNPLKVKLDKAGDLTNQKLPTTTAREEASARAAIHQIPPAPVPIQTQLHRQIEAALVPAPDPALAASSDAAESSPRDGAAAMQAPGAVRAVETASPSSPVPTQATPTQAAHAPAQPIQPAPTTAEALAPAVRDSQPIERLVETISTLREAGQSARGDMHIRHGEFGMVHMRIAADNDDVQARLTSRDPAFSLAAQSALAERVVVAASDSSAANQRQTSDDPSQNNSAQNSANNAARHNGSEARGEGRQDHPHGQSESDSAPSAPRDAHAGARDARAVTTSQSIRSGELFA